MTSILIIEKDEPRLRLMEWGLREEGFEVATATDLPAPGAELKPDVIVLNTGMPVASKRVWIETLRYIVEDVRVIDLVDAGTDEATYNSGADAYLREPFRLDYLRTAMATVLGHAVTDAPRTGHTND